MRPRVSSTRPSPRAVASALVLAFLLAACGDDGGPGSRVPAASIELAAGGGQAAEVDAVLPVAPRVLVKDSAGRPLSGVLVTFVARRGHIERGQVRTADNGTASPGQWRLPQESGLDTIVVTVSGVAPFLVTARARAGEPVSIGVANANGFQSRVLENMDLPVFRVLDRFGNGVPGVTMALRVLNRDGTMPTSRLTPATDVTDDFGIVGATGWLPYVIGEHRVEASADGLTTVATRSTRTDACGARRVIGMGMTATFDFDATTKVAACGDTIDLVTVVLTGPATITVQADPRASSPVDVADVRSAWLTFAPAWSTSPQVVVAQPAPTLRSQFSATRPGGNYDIRVAMPRAMAARGSTVQVTVTASAPAMVASAR